MAIERRLTEIVGPVGRQAAHRPLAQRPGGDRPRAVTSASTPSARGELVAALMERLLELAEAHRDWPMPGYTHLQRAQPVYLGHHLLAYFWMLERDAGPLRRRPRRDRWRCRSARARSPGVNWELDRDATAAELGFARPAPNSIDAVSNRDFALDYLVRGDGLRHPPVAAREPRS